MGKKAVYGALMGLGQGISQYGGALTTDALRVGSDQWRICGSFGRNKLS